MHIDALDQRLLAEQEDQQREFEQAQECFRAELLAEAGRAGIGC